jgi:class 3 adenylate cyclase/tetratricopeptide (TPR) repeat protein
MAACPACGHENADSAKFCSECGTALAVAETRGREERKVVTVVFVDLVGSTARAESSDPEDVRALLRVYHERARDELESFGGTVEKFIGDAVVAVFGAPVAHEDDPERGVRAALAVRDAVTQLNDDEPGRDLHVRVAVNTGVALVSLDATPAEGEAMVAGDVINTAARIQSSAPVDGILVGEQTFRATEREIVYRDADPIDARGKAEPVHVWEAVEARARLGVDLGGAGRAPLVGRDRELDLLADALRRTRMEQSTQLVTLVGVPGIGKSRLLFELSRIVDADEELINWRQGRSLPYGEGISFWALGEIVKAQAGILESDPADVTETKLDDSVSMIADAGERAWVAKHVRPLVGLATDAATSGDRRGEAFAAWRRFVEALALGGPTVLLFEDIHWADDGLLDFVDSLVDWVDGVPLLVVCTARPELLVRRSGWGGGKRNATTVSLTPLDDDEIGRLVLALLERSVIDAATQMELVERAAGNPLYAEEFVRMLEAGGSVDGRLPETVQGIVAARIDLLPKAEKELLQHASVLGKVFWSDALAAVGGLDAWELQEALRSLERKEFVRREHRSAVAGASQHAFHHALVRDAAYGQIPRAARASRHVAAAEWIDSLPEDRSEDRAATVAHHYVTAIGLFRATGHDDRSLSTRAANALLEAGERSLSLHSYNAAAHSLEQALELLPDGEGPSAEMLLAAGTAFGYVGRRSDELARAVEAFERLGNPERAAEAAVMASRHGWHAMASDVDAWLERAATLVEDRPPSRAKALVVGERARRNMLTYRPETGYGLASEAVELARQVGDVEIEAHSLVTLGCARVSLGDADGIEDLKVALELVNGRGMVAGRALTNLGWAYGVIGDVQRGYDTALDSVTLAEREGDLQSAWFTRGNLVSSGYSLGAWDEALEIVDALVASVEAGQPHYLESPSRVLRGRIRLARGELDQALADSDAALEAARRTRDIHVLYPALAFSARALVEGGDAARAAFPADELLGRMRPTDVLPGWLAWSDLAVALLELGRGPELLEWGGAAGAASSRWLEAALAYAAGDFARAADTYMQIGALPEEAHARRRAGSNAAAEAFFGRVGAARYLRAAAASD